MVPRNCRHTPDVHCRQQRNSTADVRNQRNLFPASAELPMTGTHLARGSAGEYANAEPTSTTSAAGVLAGCCAGYSTPSHTGSGSERPASQYSDRPPAGRHGVRLRREGTRSARTVSAAGSAGQRRTAVARLRPPPPFVAVHS